ncbi:NOG1-domain-containing protein [Fragilariopsis cylindrus CCMP1102]|uniref:NOG1-domain-containing protein n=1 Tax=Fragilariopsis cylindrus CCMP1102 TaxID=635003 RepID=A0A1E7ES89_9STRA|nr:NOG1-domain-containing protein [Fragilariopsis cylindrus CCMP1102]|eukprot:OEU08716.1 NOG1-domain-containing protein [Fragilariopsis cylindrus CCMP1102]
MLTGTTTSRFLTSAPSSALSSTAISSSSSDTTTTTTTTTDQTTKTKEEAKVTTTESKPKNKNKNKNFDNNNNINADTGGLRRLPVVKSPIELSNKAEKVASWTKVDDNVKNVRNRARKHGTETLNTLTQQLCIPLRDIVNGYRRELKRLHPFEKTVADLTVRARIKKDGLTLTVLLDDINEARKMILETGKEWVYKAKYAETAKEANLAKEEGVAHLLSLYKEFAFEPVSGMVDLQRSLRSAPAVQLDSPAVVLVGAPNVGKSSIVRCISSATPEVNNYPFTTRGMTLGHVEVFWQAAQNSTTNKSDNPSSSEEEEVAPSSLYEIAHNRYAFSQLCQIMDSPGVLVRPPEEEYKRNEMEELTLAAMKHLPTAVMYVMDLSGQAGDKCSSVEDQLALRKEIRTRFPRRPWIDVVSKIDLGIENDSVLDELDAMMIETGEQYPYIKLSIHDEIGIDELRIQVLRMLGEVRVVLDAMGGSGSPVAAATTTKTKADDKSQ